MYKYTVDLCSPQNVCEFVSVQEMESVSNLPLIILFYLQKMSYFTLTDNPLLTKMMAIG